MREFEQKKKIRKILYSRTMIFFLFLVFVFLLQATWRVYHKQAISRQSLNQVIQESKRLDDRERAIQASVDYLQTDKGVEAEIRSKFRATKPGEQVAIIINDEVKRDISVPTQKTLWQKILDFFDIL